MNKTVKIVKTVSVSLLFASLLFISLAPVTSVAKGEPEIVTLSVTDNGFEPSKISVKPGVPIVLKVTRKTDATCATQIQIPSQKVKKDLPLNQEVTIDIGSLKKGDLKYGCGMGMMLQGVIKVE